MLFRSIHSAGVVHRDLKPGNILVDENCDLKICDFGLARTLDLSMTGYVTTRFYRAPETMLTWQNYGVGVDMWSAGCILAEMIEGEPLFPGRDHADQFLVISSLLGSIHPDVLPNLCTESVSMCALPGSIPTILTFFKGLKLHCGPPVPRKSAIKRKTQKCIIKW